jgi:xanthine dehydrogenase molybdopterin-binding subunit B
VIVNNSLREGSVLEIEDKLAIGKALRQAYTSRDLNSARIILTAAKARQDEKLDSIIQNEFYMDTYKAARMHNIEELSRLLDFGATLHPAVVTNLVNSAEDIANLNLTIEMFQMILARGFDPATILDLLA